METVKNKVQLTGKISRKPEIKTTSSGKKLAMFSIGTLEFFRNSKGDQANQMQWHWLVAWGQVAEQVEQKVDKGMEISIEGRLVSRNYLDKQGKKKYVTEVLVQELNIL